MTDLYSEALATFSDLLARAKTSADPEPTAMTVASADATGRLSIRTVLLKQHDARGFVFYTNLQSRKGEELIAHPQAALLFHWKHLDAGIQVRIEGAVEQVDDAEADAYFASRPRPSQLGAWASDQSRVLPSRAVFDARFAEAEQRFSAGNVPRPTHWSGLRVVPDRLEFWYGAQYRLHERQRYLREDGVWTRDMLYP